jgi:polygalacturonase
MDEEIVLGSEITGGVRNVFVENSQMDSPHLDSAMRLKNDAVRGGLLENICVRNIEVGEVAGAGLSVDFFSEEGGAGKFTPQVHNVEIRNMRTKKTKYALYLRGLKKAHIKDVRLLDGDFEEIAQLDVVANVNRLALRNAREYGKLMPPVESRKCVSC